MRSLPLLLLALTLCGCAALCPRADQAPEPAECTPASEAPAAQPATAAPAAQPASEAQPAPGAYSAQAALDPEQRDVYTAATRDSEARTLRPRTVAVQVVNGLNYDFRCLSEDGRRRYSVIIHRPLPQSGQDPRVISIRELPDAD